MSRSSKMGLVLLWPFRPFRAEESKLQLAGLLITRVNELFVHSMTWNINIQTPFNKYLLKLKSLPLRFSQKKLCYFGIHWTQIPISNHPWTGNWYHYVTSYKSESKTDIFLIHNSENLYSVTHAAKIFWH